MIRFNFYVIGNCFSLHKNTSGGAHCGVQCRCRKLRPPQARVSLAKLYCAFIEKFSYETKLLEEHTVVYN